MAIYGKRGKVLIVEDDHLQSYLLKMLLLNEGFEVSGNAFSGKEAISMAKEYKPEIILMDIKLNGEIDGIEAASIIQEFLHFSLIYLSGYTFDSFKKKLSGTDYHSFLAKPISHTEMIKTLNSISILSS